MWQQCRVKIKKPTATYRKIGDSNQRNGRGRADFSYYYIINGVMGTRTATEQVNLCSCNSTSQLHRPALSAHDSEEESTDDEEGDEVEDGEENGGGSPQVVVGVPIL